MMVEPMDGVDAAEVRAADETGRARIWTDLVAKFGRTEASRRWLAIFAALPGPPHRAAHIATVGHTLAFTRRRHDALVSLDMS